MDAIFQLIGELLLQVVVEALGELGLHSLGEPFRRKPNAWMAALGYTLFGLIGGLLSLLVVTHLLVPPQYALANLVISPIVAGLVMSGIGSWRRRRGDPVLRIDRFGDAFLFALVFAGVRFAAFG